MTEGCSRASRNASAVVSCPAARCSEILVDASARSDRHDADEPSRPIELVDDAESPYAVSPEPSELSTQRLADRRGLAQRVERAADAALEIGMECADDLGGLRSNDEPISAHRPSAPAGALGRLAEHLVEGQPLPPTGEVALAAPDLAHQVRIAEHSDGGFQALVLGEVDEDRRRTTLAGDDDLFLAFLHPGQERRKMRLHLGNRQRSGHAEHLIWTRKLVYGTNARFGVQGKHVVERFAQVVLVTGESQVAHCVHASVLLGSDMLDVKCEEGIVVQVAASSSQFRTWRDYTSRPSPLNSTVDSQLPSIG